MSTVLITGTSSGIGLATAVTLSRTGHTVFAGMRSLASSAALRAIAAREDLPLTIVQLDVQHQASVDRAVEYVTGTAGLIDVLVNNAGLGSMCAVADTPIDEYRRLMETNLYGALRCTQAVLPAMRARRSGIIVNVSSLGGRFALAQQGAYGASKWALEGASECLAYEMAPFNVRVAIVEPGVTASPSFAKAMLLANPDDRQRRRLAALFKALLPTPTSSYLVAEQIRLIVEGEERRLRFPVGLDALLLLNWRESMTDLEWVALGAASDDDWSAVIKRQFGVDVPCESAPPSEPFTGKVDGRAPNDA